MKQTKSTSNFSKLLRREVMRQMPLGVLTLLALLAVLPGYALVAIQSMEGAERMDFDLVGAAAGLLYGNPWVILVMELLAVLSASALFHYLHIRQQTDFYHALPISRWKLFARQTLTGIALIVPIYAINLLLLCLVYTVKGYGDCLIVVLLLQKAIIELSTFVIVYAISVLACILCGSTLAALTVNFGLQVGLYALWECVLIVFRTFYPAHILFMKHWDMHFLSPMIHQCGKIGRLQYFDVDYPDGLIGLISNGTVYRQNNLMRISLCYLLVAVVILLLAALLYRRRRSERTGQAIVFRGLRLPIKYAAMTLCGILCGWVMFLVTDLWPTLFVGMAAGVILAQCVIEIVFGMELRAMFSHQLSLWVYLIAAVIAVGAMHLDVTGYNETLPERADIAAADVYSYEHALTTRDYAGQDGELTEEMLQEMECDLLTDAASIDEIYAMAQRGVQSMRDHRESISYNTEYDVIFRLRDGTYFVRSYYLAGDQDSEEYRVLTERAAGIRFSEQYLASRTPAAMADAGKTEKLLIANSSQAGCAGELVEDADAIAALLDSVREESQQLTEDYVTEHPPILMLHTLPDGAWERRQSGEKELYTLDCAEENEFNIPVYACEKQTIALLKEMGIAVERFTLSDVQAVELWSYPQAQEDLTLRSAVTADRDAKSVQIAESSQFGGILAGAAAQILLDACDPIVSIDGTADSYDGMLTRTEGEICFRYMKNMVPVGLDQYW